MHSPTPLHDSTTICVVPPVDMTKQAPPRYALSPDDAAAFLSVALDEITSNAGTDEPRLNRQYQFANVVMLFHMLIHGQRTSSRDIAGIGGVSIRSVAAMMQPLVSKDLVRVDRVTNNISLDARGTINMYYLSHTIVKRTIALRKRS